MKKGAKNLIAFILLFVLICIGKDAYAVEKLTNATRAYFCSEITKNYGNGDCILLENYDSNGKTIYGLIDTGRKIEKKDKDGNNSTVVNEFLKNHGVQKLDFLLITHQHGDHNGDALTVLDNFNVDKIYMKEFDKKWSPNGTQETYEEIIKKAVSKNIKVIGVSFSSLSDKTISPSISENLLNNTIDAKQKLFEGFDKNNTVFNFGSCKIQIFNWEMFDESGKQYITGETTKLQREIDNNENNNSLGILLTQGKKKAFFAGDINNLDEDKEKGSVGDENRIKDNIGKVDFLKLAHHGYQDSNTEDFMNVLKPEYAIITNDVGKIYKNTESWLKENNVNYLYSTEDEYAVSATITNDNVYLGFETLVGEKIINNTSYYIPTNNPNADYTRFLNKENKIVLTYSTVKPTNKDVTVKIKSENELQNLEEWTLSDNNKTLTKTYKENTKEKIQVTDFKGEVKETEIEIKNIDKILPKIKETSSEKTEDNKIILKVRVNEKIETPKGWEYDEKNEEIYKEYSKNIEETAELKDLAGNILTAKIKIDSFEEKTVKKENTEVSIVAIENEKKDNETTIKKEETAKEKTENVDGTTAKGRLPQTGLGKFMVFLGTFLTILWVFSFIKIRIYKEI